ncbi:MAG: hypothetical protein J6K17_14580 [Oscillospiraceae bacterium]|nr:hypothetical protein [Oscillospiraceae bacterium]
MILTAPMARRIVGEAVTKKVLILTVTEREQRDLKHTLTDHIKEMRIWELVSRQTYRYHIHISGMESICIMDYATWTKESQNCFYGTVFVTSKHLLDLPNVSGEPILLG